MAPNHYLQFAGIFLSCFLKVAAGCVVCLCLSRMLHGPHHRFRVWLALVLASGAYWLALLSSLVHAWPKGISDSSHLSLPGMAVSPIHWRIPLRWNYDVTVSGRILLGAYLGVIFLLACRKAWVHIGLRKLLRMGTAASAEVSLLFENMRRDLGLGRCELTILPGLASPATAFWRRPLVVLPEEAVSQGATPQLASVLYHELAHVLRRDYLWANITDVVCGLLFFHPAVWQARKHMRLERELACDLAVVAAAPDFRADYADNLARFVRRRILNNGVNCGIDFAAPASMLGVRIRNILAEPVHVPWWKKISTATASAGLMLVFFVVSPELSVGIDFASDAARPMPAAGAQPAVKSAAIRHRPLTAAPARKHSQEREQDTRPEDSLRGVGKRSYLSDSPAYRMTSGDYRPDSEFSSPNWDAPAMSEPSPATRTPGVPSVTGSVARIVLSTVGGVLVHERSEHGSGHGRTR